MPAATIISAVIALGGTLLSSYITSQEVEDAQREARQLANIRRQDELRREEEAKRMSRAGLALQRQSFRQGIVEAEKGRKRTSL